MDQSIVRALDLAAERKWDEARRAVEGVGDPIATRLQALFDELRRCEDEQAHTQSATRHELGNLLTIAQSNVEGMLDGVLEPTPGRLDNVREALASATNLMTATKPAATEIREFLSVRCPYASARHFLEADMRAQVGSPGTLRLSVPLAGVRISKNVVVMISPGDDPMHMDQPWHVRWTPEGGGPYPDFDGELTVRADEDWDTAQLELRGVYVPPGGALGKAFDRTIGRRIASATAQSLLRNVASTLETRYRKQEAEKHGGSLDEE